MLIAVYAIFAVSAGARSVFQISTKFEQAPFAYFLSFIAAVVYLVAAVSLGKPELKPFTAFLLSFELLGVVTVGTLSFINPELFAHPSVWSWFGSGYAFLPLVLPIAGLIWLRRS